MAVLLPIIGNLVFGVALNLVSSWLFPSKQPKINEDIPNLGTGSNLCIALGFTFSTTALIAYTKSSLSGGSSDRSSYTLLGLVNPTSLKILAIRHNNQTVATKTSFFPLSTFESNATYTDSQGFKCNEGFAFYAQTNSTVPNNNFGLLGYPDVQYKGLTWEQVVNSKNSVTGGASGSSNWIVQNGTEGTVTFSDQGDGNHPIKVVFRGVRFDFFGFTQTFFTANMPSGFRGCRFMRTFTYQNNPGVHRDSAMFALGNNIEIFCGGAFYIQQLDMFSAEPYTPAPAIAGSTLGYYYPNALVDTAANQTGIVTTVLLASSAYQGVRSVTIPASNAPLSGDFLGTNIRNSSGGVIGTKAAGEWVVGWNGKMFTIDPGNPDPGGQTYTGFVSNALPVNSAVRGTTSLVEIVTTLMEHKEYILNTDFSFSPGFNEKVIGFTTELNNVDATLNNLLTLYKKIIVESRGGVIKFLDYSELDYVGATVITQDDLVNEPDLKISPYVDQPDAVELVYRSYNKSFAEDTIVVGTGFATNRTSIRLDIVETPDRARELAWRAFKLIRGTYLQAKLKLSPKFQTIENGDILNYRLPPDFAAANNTTEMIQLLVVSSAYGADRSIEVECINLISNSDSLTVEVTPTVGVNVNLPTPPPSLPAIAKYIDAEPVPGQFETGGIVISRVAASSTQKDVRASIFGQDIKMSVFPSIDPPGLGQASLMDIATGTLSNTVLEGDILGWGYKSVSIILTSPLMSLKLTNGRLRAGDSWMTYTTAVFQNEEWILTGIKTGLYGSKEILVPGDSIYQGYARSPWYKSNDGTANNFNIFEIATQALDTEQSPTINIELLDASPSISTLPITPVFNRGNPYRTTAAGSAKCSINGTNLFVSFARPGAIGGSTFLNNQVQPNTVIQTNQINRLFEVVVSGSVIATFGSIGGVFEYDVVIPFVSRGILVKVREYRLSGDNVPYYGTWENDFYC